MSSRIQSTQRVAQAWSRQALTMWDTQEEFEAYKKEHPDLDSANHKVRAPLSDEDAVPDPEPPRKKKPAAPDIDDEDAVPDPEPPRKKEPEAPDPDEGPAEDSPEGKKRVEPAEPPSEEVEDAVKGDTGPVGLVVHAVKSKKWPTVGQVWTALRQVRLAPEVALSDDQKAEQIKATKEMTKFLMRLLGESEEKEEVLDVKPSRHRNKRDDSLSKNQSKLLKDYAMTVGKDDQKSPEEIRKDFLENVDDPDDKERFEEMSAKEFMAAFEAIIKGKKGSLRERIIRLAYVRPDLRVKLLSVLGDDA